MAIAGAVGIKGRQGYFWDVKLYFAGRLAFEELDVLHSEDSGSLRTDEMRWCWRCGMFHHCGVFAAGFRGVSSGRVT